MANGGIEDILIGAGNNSNEKKGKKGIFFFMFFLLIIIGIAVYIFYIKPKYTKVDVKKAFFDNLSSSNVVEISNKNIYKNLRKRLLTENSEIQNSINFSSTMNNFNSSEVDVSKFTLDFNNRNDIKNEKMFNELGIIYSGNKIIKIQTISDEDKIAAYSDKIVNKFVGFHYDRINEFLENDYNLTNLYNMREDDNIELTEDELEDIIKKYRKIIYNKIPQENFSMQDNLVIENGSKEINVKGYTLNLSQNEMKEILISILNDIKANDELLKKVITNGKSKVSLELKTNDYITELQPTRPIENYEEEPEEGEFEEEQEEEYFEENTEEEFVTEEYTEGESENFNTEEVIDLEIRDIVSNLDPVQEIENEEENFEEEEILEENREDIEEKVLRSSRAEKDPKQEFIKDTVLRIILGKKIATTLEDTQNKLDEIIEKIDKYEGNGLKITVYVSDEKTEKVSIVLPNEDTLDLEVLSKTNKENSFDITYLYKGKNNLLEKILKKFNEYFEANTVVELVKPDDPKANGFKLSVNQIQDSANTTTKLVYNFIEREKINKKITLNLETDGTNSGKNFNSDIVLTFSTNAGETKVIMDNKITFKKEVDVDNLSDVNCVFLDTLPLDEYDETILAIKEKVNEVYESEKEKLDFIDINLSKRKNHSKLTSYNTIKDSLINKVNEIRDNAIRNEVEFTFQDLEGLEIEGYSTSVTIDENSAIVVVDVYTFSIDSEFNVTDV